ncbi:MAG: phosphoribosylamine--glycine ligase [Ignavibacteria bacterium]|jgi:phosphoribosylamine--glycine ligase|nr:phosphoribosylamine--glycine ligase [Ignavibacteria bacterium]
MNILVIGSGGREHAIVRVLSSSKSATKIFCSPGNPGIATLAECVSINNNNFNDVSEFCLSNDISLVVVGPEQPIANGIADAVREKQINVFAPSLYASQLEASKAFAKNFMQRYNIPTAKYAVFDSTTEHQAEEYVITMQLPIVIKADGLAAGKGVVITENMDEAIATLKEFFNGAFGEASKKVVIEEFMQGEEASIFAICDGSNYITLSPAQDHKRIGDGDTGKNTGGMGAYTPVPIVTDAILQKVRIEIIEPTLAGMQAEGHPYIGCLYVGLMIDNGTPRVVEFNVRFGDPETQAVLSAFNGDFAHLLYTAAIGQLDKTAVVNSNIAACCVILASDGYPDKYKTDFEITGELNSEHCYTYHSGTKLANGKLLTAGGRVLGVTAVADTIEDAIALAYKQANGISFDNKYCRSDIGQKSKKTH